MTLKTGPLPYELLETRFQMALNQLEHTLDELKEARRRIAALEAERRQVPRLLDTVRGFFRPKPKTINQKG